jgi:hypothetical protein
MLYGSPTSIKARLQEFAQLLQALVISPISSRAKGLDQLMCDGRPLRGSAVEAEGGSYRFVSQLTVYARALGVALAQRSSTPTNPVNGLPPPATPPAHPPRSAEHSGAGRPMNPHRSVAHHLAIVQ